MNLLKPDDNASAVLVFVTLIGAAVLAVRLLIWTDTFHTGLLYIAWPFALSLALYYLTPATEGTSWKRRFWNNLRISLIVMLASSLILMEGYVCVVMFMPIFFLGVLIAFVAFYLYHRYGKRSIGAHLVPLTVAVLALEGVTDETTFNRYNEVSHSQIVQADVAQLKQRLARLPEPRGKRHWILALFPMPETIGSVRVEQGAVRTYDFVYHRWFTTNTHAGSIRVTFAEVSESRIRTRIEDTSYISGYLKLHGSELVLEPVSPTETRVTLTVAYDRMIDPIWYFGPLQRLAVEKGAKFFIEGLLNNDAPPAPMPTKQARS